MTDIERLILVNQYDILTELFMQQGNTRMADDYKRLSTIVSEGYAGEYETLTNRLFPELSIDECKFVKDVLRMYWVIYDSYTKLANPKISRERIVFDGFDGNEESYHYSYCKFLLEECKYYPDLSENNRTGFNSHSNRCKIYREMLDKWMEMGKPTKLTEAEIEFLITW